MAVSWTEEQKKVIELRNRSLLVSAAAGSGKTAVLVRRIIRMVTDPVKPLDIDRLLIMTFTRAAAGEMKERLTQALEEEVYRFPDNEHLLRQLNLIHTAQITTIDGFCAWLLKNYFHLIGLDPGFRVAEEGELRLLEEDVMQKLLEDSYALEDPAFLHFAESFARGRDDEPLGSLILRVYHAAMSFPDPEKWLQSCLDAYGGQQDQDPISSALESYMWDMISVSLEDARRLAEKAIACCRRPDGPVFYEDALAGDLNQITELFELYRKRDFDRMNRALDQLSFAALSRKRMPDAEDRWKERVKSLREEEKKRLLSLREKYLSTDRQGLQQERSHCRQDVEQLVNLTLSFHKRFLAAKREKNLLDFTDMEHLALQILLTPDGEKSPAAAELSARYEEVLIDEYQDSNDVQEQIAQAVSGWIREKKNLFMVGDVKQSIYRFRQARPQLFMEKYASFTLEESPEQKIDLHRNFRSRPQVLDAVNYVFEQTMGADLGGVDYDEAARLVPGAVFPDLPEPDFVFDNQSCGEPNVSSYHSQLKSDLSLCEENRMEFGTDSKDSAGQLYDTELLLVDTSADPLAANEITGTEEEETRKEGIRKEETEKEEAGMDGSGEEEIIPGSRQMEALAVASRIRQLEGKLPVYDRELGGYRPARLGDMVILLRTAAGWAEPFSEALASKGIPTYTASRTGYFSAREVVNVLNYLRICDNPLQDIPLVGVLRSPMGRFTPADLAELRIACPEGCLYDSILRYTGRSHETDSDILPEETGLIFSPDNVGSISSLDDAGSVSSPDDAGLVSSPEDTGSDSSLRERLTAFCNRLDSFRDRAVYTPIHQLISEILEETGYGLYLKAMPSGLQRTANIRMLIEKAREFEKTSYRGLFRFIRYMEHLEKYEVDFGEVNLAADNENCVRIMTIHKSKGLEFPIVFVCGLGKKYNLMDLHQDVLLHPDLGIGIPMIDPELRCKTATLQASLIRDRLREESLGEELRVLYVAMTRAKEKLILTAAIDDLEDRLPDLADLCEETEVLLPLGRRLAAGSFLDILLSSLARHRCMNSLYQEHALFPDKAPGLWNDDAVFTILVTVPEKLAVTAIFDQAEREIIRQQFWQLLDRQDTSGREDSLSQAAQTDGDHLFNSEGLTDREDSLAKRFQYQYPWDYLRSLPVKVSVSELKKRSMTEEDEPVSDPFFEPDIIPLIPSFIQEKGEEKLSGADRGTAYHRFMECLDYHRLPLFPLEETESGTVAVESEFTRVPVKQENKTTTRKSEIRIAAWKKEVAAELENQLQALTAGKKMTQVQADTIKIDDILHFCETPLGRRMHAAAQQNNLIREQPFVFSRPARELDPAWPYDEPVLIQGIIDAFFFEKDHIILVDYKTDRLLPGQESILADKYRVQLEDYAVALTRLTRKPVTESWLYSFTLGKEIRL